MQWTTKSSVPQSFSTSAKTASMRGRIGDVAMADDRGVELLRQRLDALFQRVALIGESQFGAVVAGRPGRCPRRSSGCWQPP